MKENRKGREQKGVDEIMESRTVKREQLLWALEAFSVGSQSRAIPVGSALFSSSLSVSLSPPVSCIRPPVSHLTTPFIRAWASVSLLSSPLIPLMRSRLTLQQEPQPQPGTPAPLPFPFSQEALLLREQAQVRCFIGVRHATRLYRMHAAQAIRHPCWCWRWCCTKVERPLVASSLLSVCTPKLGHTAELSTWAPSEPWVVFRELRCQRME